MKKMLCLCFVSLSVGAMPVAVPQGYELPKESYSVEPFCTSSTICVKNDWHIRSVQTADYQAIRQVVSAKANYKEGWLNSLDYIMPNILLFKSYRNDYGLTELLLEKNAKGQWVILRESGAIY